MSQLDHGDDDTTSNNTSDSPPLGQLTVPQPLSTSGPQLNHNTPQYSQFNNNTNINDDFLNDPNPHTIRLPPPPLTNDLELVSTTSTELNAAPLNPIKRCCDNAYCVLPYPIPRSRSRTTAQPSFSSPLHAHMHNQVPCCYYSYGIPCCDSQLAPLCCSNSSQPVEDPMLAAAARLMHLGSLSPLCIHSSISFSPWVTPLSVSFPRASGVFVDDELAMFQTDTAQQPVPVHPHFTSLLSLISSHIEPSRHERAFMQTYGRSYDVNTIVDVFGSTLLMHAVLNDKLHRISYFDAPFDPNQPNLTGKTASDYVMRFLPDSVQEFHASFPCLARDPPPQIVGAVPHRRPALVDQFCLDVYRGENIDEIGVRYAPISPHTRNDHGWTPLLFAVWYNRVDFIYEMRRSFPHHFQPTNVFLARGIFAAHRLAVRFRFFDCLSIIALDLDTDELLSHLLIPNTFIIAPEVVHDPFFIPETQPLMYHDDIMYDDDFDQEDENRRNRQQFIPMLQDNNNNDNDTLMTTTIMTAIMAAMNNNDDDDDDTDAADDAAVAVAVAAADVVAADAADVVADDAVVADVVADDAAVAIDDADDADDAAAADDDYDGDDYDAADDYYDGDDYDAAVALVIADDAAVAADAAAAAAAAAAYDDSIADDDYDGDYDEDEEFDEDDEFYDDEYDDDYDDDFEDDEFEDEDFDRDIDDIEDLLMNPVLPMPLKIIPPPMHACLADQYYEEITQHVFMRDASPRTTLTVAFPGLSLPVQPNTEPTSWISHFPYFHIARTRNRQRWVTNLKKCLRFVTKHASVLTAAPTLAAPTSRNSLCNISANTPLHVLVALPHASCHVHTFCKYFPTVDINAQNLAKSTPVMEAIKTRNCDLVRFFFARYSFLIDFNVLDVNGENILLHAVRSAHPAITFLIFGYLPPTADINFQNRYGQTMLHIVAQINKPHVITWLTHAFHHQTIPYICDIGGNTPVAVAAYYRHHGVICALQFFFSEDIAIHFTNMSNQSAISIAVAQTMRGDYHTLQYFMLLMGSQIDFNLLQHMPHLDLALLRLLMSQIPMPSILRRVSDKYYSSVPCLTTHRPRCCPPRFRLFAPSMNLDYFH